MRKAALSVMTVSMLGLTGCSFESFSADDDRTQIEIMSGKVEINDQFEALADKYEEENPDVDIRIISVGGGSDYLGTLKSRFASGDAPDVFSAFGPVELEQFDAYLTDLSDMESAETALEGTLEDVTYGDNIYGLPFNLEGYGLIYNKEIFEQAGVDAESIQSYEDLEAAVQTIDSQKEELGIEAAFAYPGREAWVTGGHLANAFLAPEFNESSREAWDSDTVEFERGDEFKRMFDLQTDYSIKPVLSINYSQQVEQYFAQGDVAMIQQGNWVYPSLAQSDEEFANEGIDMMPIPVEGREGDMPVGVPNYWAVNNDNNEETIQEAKDFLDWMNNSETGKETVLNEFNFVPAYEGYNTSEISDPLSQKVNEHFEEDNVINWVMSGYPSAFDSYLGSQAQRYLSEDYTWEEVLQAAREEWESKKESQR